MSRTGEPLLSIDDLEVHYDDESAVMEATPDWVKEQFGWSSEPVRAVDGVDLEIDEQDVVAVIGESGSGKTTLGKTAVALEEPTGGSVNYRGHDIWDVKRKKQVDDVRYEDIRRSLQIVHQDAEASLNPYRTIMTTLLEPLQRWFPELSHADRRERILGLFEEVGLTPPQEYEDRYPHELSGGEQQRVSLIRAMLLEPELILADEPVSALDPSLGIELMDLMLELQEMFETSFLFVSHNLHHASYFASQADGRVAVMYLGEIVEIGSAEEVLENPSHPYTQVLKWATMPSHPDEAREKLETQPPLRGFEAPDSVKPPSGCRFHTRCPKARRVCEDQPPELMAEGTDGHEAACFRVDPDHEYWQSDHIDERGEIEIPT